MFDIDRAVEGNFYKTVCPKCGWQNSVGSPLRYCPKCSEDLLTMSLHKKEDNEMKYRVFEKDDNYMTSDEVADLLVRLYAEYRRYSDILEFSCNKDYSKAVGMAIRMLSD